MASNTDVLIKIEKLVRGFPDKPDLDYLDDWERGHTTGEADLARRIRKIINEG